MQEVPEVNASLFREVRYGETVTIDPMKWVMEQFIAGTEHLQRPLHLVLLQTLVSALLI